MECTLFTVSYAGLWGQHALDAASSVRKAAALGFSSILFMAKPPHLFPMGSEEETIEHIEAALAETGLRTVGLAGYTDFLLQAPAEVPVLDMQIAYVRGCCILARRLGGTVVRIFTGYLSDEADLHTSWKRIIKTLQRCGDIAGEHGVTLAVQNHHDLGVATEEMTLLLEEVGHPHVRAGFDAWSPYLRGEDLGKVSRVMAPLTELTIAANYRTFPRYTYHPDAVNYTRRSPDIARATLMSAGEIDYRTFLDGLKSGGYDGPVVYEMCSPLIGGGSEENLDRHAADFLSWMAVYTKECT